MNPNMNCLLKPHHFDQWEQNSYILIENFLPQETAEALLGMFADLDLFQSAQIGRSNTEASKTKSIRSDRIRWVELESLLPDAHRVIEQIRNELNENLFLGIQQFESHLAHYEDGQFYDFHFDEHQSGFAFTSRAVSMVVYLNKNWLPEHQGRLLIKSDQRQIAIEPTWNRAILFDSKKILHAVEKSLAPRHSLTGWFRNRR